MSLALVGKILEDGDITDPRECLVLLALADATNKETLLCYPSVERISQVARCGRSTAIRVLKRLEEKGWIQIIRRKGLNGVDLANTYRVIKYGYLMPSIEPKGEGVTVRPSPLPQRDPRVAQRDLPNIDEPVRESTRARESSAKPASEEEVVSFVTSLELPSSDGVWAWHHWLGNGFTNGGKPIKNWKATLRAWKAGNYMPSQKRPRPPKDPNDSF